MRLQRAPGLSRHPLAAGAPPMLGAQIRCKGGYNAPCSEPEARWVYQAVQGSKHSPHPPPLSRSQESTASPCWSSSSRSTTFQSSVSACCAQQAPARRHLRRWGRDFLPPNNLGNKRGGISSPRRSAAVRNIPATHSAAFASSHSAQLHQQPACATTPAAGRPAAQVHSLQEQHTGSGALLTATFLSPTCPLQ